MDGMHFAPQAMLVCLEGEAEPLDGCSHVFLSATEQQLINSDDSEFGEDRTVSHPTVPNPILLGDSFTFPPHPLTETKGSGDSGHPFRLVSTCHPPSFTLMGNNGKHLNMPQLPVCQEQSIHGIPDSRGLGLPRIVFFLG